MKSVAFIVQFIIFFTIGLIFFLAAGNLFRFQSNILKRDILDISSELTSNYISAVAIASINTCKYCDNVSVKVNVNPIVGYYPIFELDKGIVISIEPENKSVSSSIHNLNNSISFTTSKVSSVKPITLTYDRTKNNLVIK